MEERDRTLNPGDKLGSFVISELLGVGGMGEVYRARDTKLGREVAIKVLPKLVSSAERDARFQREARLLASLNHPNIAAIYGFDEVDSTRFIVLELVEGKTLGDRLRHGPLSVEEALEIGQQIAVALEAAHANGVIHRDLKPANIKITPDGKVKVLDFGLAKTLSDQVPAASSAEFDSPTQTFGISAPAVSEMATQEGVLLGTAPYMSPEQARAKEVDTRSDVWSFGCVLFECLSGKLLFGGQSVADALGAILHKEPDWDTLPVETPPTVQLLLRRCLTKDRRLRLHDIANARIELELALANDPSCSQLGLPGPAIAERSQRTALRKALPAFIVGLAVVLTAIGTYLATTSFRAPAAAPRSVRLQIPSKTSSYRRARGASISPDGQQIVFVANSVSSGSLQLWLRRLDSFDAQPISGTENLDGNSDFVQVGWSESGDSIFFHRGGKLWSTRLDGSAPKPLATVPGSLGITCNKDGVILFSRGETGICRLTAPGGDVEVITSLNAARNETAHVYPHFLPDGKTFLFLGLNFDPQREVRSPRLYAGTLGSSEITFIEELSSRVAYVEPGFLVYVEGGSIFTRPFDASRLRFTGEPRLLADRVLCFEPTGAVALSVSRGGSMVFTSALPRQSLVWFDKAGKRLGSVGETRRFRSLRISADGKRCLVSAANVRTGATDLLIYGLDRKTTTQLTSDIRFESNGIWARDNKTIFYSSDLHGWPDVFQMSLDGSGRATEVYRAPGQWYPEDVSPNGKFLILAGASKGSHFNLALLPLNGGGKLRVFPQSTEKNEFWARFSPDGKWVSYASDISGKAQIYVTPFPALDRQIQVSTVGGSYPVWAAKGAQLYFQESLDGKIINGRSRKLMVVDLSGWESDTSPPPPQRVFETTESFDMFDVVPAGDRFLLRVLPTDTTSFHVLLNSTP